MKKILFAMITVLVCLASCTKWDDFDSVKYGDGPSIAIDITSTADSSFTFVLTPGEGTQFYSYIVAEADEEEELDPAVLLKGGYTDVENAVIEAAKSPTFTSDLGKKAEKPKCSPNTTYYVYAIAANDKGIVGNVAVKSVTTSDGDAPYVADNDANSEEGIAVAEFSEPVVLGEGKIKAVLYKEFDILNPVELTDKDYEVTIEAEDVYFTISEPIPGSIVAFSWEAGAFCDSKGNKCAAQESGINMTTGKLVGVYVQNDTQTFVLTDENISAPEPETMFGDWKAFEGELTLDFDVYRIEEDIQDGDVVVAYANSKKTTYIKLSADDWSVNGNKLTFKLPEAPALGDEVSVSVAEGVIYDVYGNPNAEYESETYWTYYIFKVEDLYGTYSAAGISAYDGPVEEETPVIIAKDAESEDPDAVIVKNLLMEGSEMYGFIDPATATLYIEDGSLIGIVGKYGLLAVTTGESDYFSFALDAGSGVLVSEDLGIFALDAATEEPLGWYDEYEEYTLSPMAVGVKARKAPKAISSHKAKTVKLSKKARKSTKRVKK